MRTCLRGCLVGSSLVVVALAVLVAQVAREPVPYTFERGSFEQPAQAHIRLHTLAHQDYPLLAKLLIRILHPVKHLLFPLTTESLMAAAQARTNLSDFGDETDVPFRSGLAVVLEALEREGQLSVVGRLLVREASINNLMTLLRLQRLLQLHPEIRDEPIAAPVIIAGLPRTGTTHLHNLLANTQRLRFLRYFEGIDPIIDQGLGSVHGASARDSSSPPPPTALKHFYPTLEADPRVERCRMGLLLVRSLKPLFPFMHKLEPQSAQEEVQLDAIMFTSMFYEVVYTVPSYSLWYTSQADLHAGVAFTKLLMQVLQWQDRQLWLSQQPPGTLAAAFAPRRWVLKSPANIERLPQLQRVFPDARVVVTHRDPVPCMKSLLTLTSYMAGMSADRVDPAEHGPQMTARVMGLIANLLRDRQAMEADPQANPFVHHMLDVTADDFWRDNTATVRRIFEFANLPWDKEVAARTEAYVQANPRQGGRRLLYDLSLFNMTESGLREEYADVLAAYAQHLQRWTAEVADEEVEAEQKTRQD